MRDWKHEHPVGTLTGDPVPGAPELYRRILAEGIQDNETPSGGE